MPCAFERLADAPGEVGEPLDVGERQLLAVVARRGRTSCRPRRRRRRRGPMPGTSTVTPCAHAVARHVLDGDAVVVVERRPSTTPTGVSSRCVPGSIRPRCASVTTSADGAVAAHAEVADVVEEDHAGGAGRVDAARTSSAPTITSEPRGSLTTAERKSSKSLAEAVAGARPASRCPRSGPPATTTRVGSPPVWESMTLMRGSS